MKYRLLFLAAALGTTAIGCGSSQPSQQQPPPPQGYYPQQPPPQQGAPPPAAPPPTAAPPAAQPTATGAPAASGSGTPTSIPGVMKNPDGTCSLTPPGMNGQPGGPPIVGPCPPGI